MPISIAPEMLKSKDENGNWVNGIVLVDTIEAEELGSLIDNILEGDESNG